MEGARTSAPTGGRAGPGRDDTAPLAPEQAIRKIKKLEAAMYKHARNLEFEEAALVRDEIERLRQKSFGAPGQLAG